MGDQANVPEDFAAGELRDLPADLTADVHRYADAEKVDADTAVRKLLRDALERWRVERAIDRLEEGDVSFDRAVEIADATPWEFADRLEDRGVQWVDSDHLSRDLEEL